MCRKPEELLLVTFNHLDGMRKSVGGSLEHVDLINSVYRRTKEVRQTFSEREEEEEEEEVVESVLLCRL